MQFVFEQSGCLSTWSLLRIDAMDELRAASNQVELERVQRNLARLQRLGDKHGSLVTGL